MTHPDILSALRARAEAIRSKFGVLELSVFGSVIRGEATPMSDVDILVSFDGPATFDQFMGLKLFLEDQLGARVDLVTSKALRPEIRPIVEREAVRVA